MRAPTRRRARPGFATLALLLLGPAGFLKACAPAPALAPGQQPDSRHGERVYQAHCARCHEQGLNGAPKLADPAAWRSATAQPLPTLTAHARSGILQMPAQCKPAELTDQDAADAVQYILDRIGAGR